MLRFLASRLVASVAVVVAILTLSFFMMRWAPGSPFDEDKRLPAAVEANKWLAFDMGDQLIAPFDGVVSVHPDIRVDGEYAADTPICTVTDPFGARFVATMPTDGKLVQLVARDGEAVTAGARLAVVPKTLWSQYVSSLANYAQLDFGVTISSDGQRRVSEVIGAGLPVSVELSLWALTLALLLGVSAGLYAGLKQNTLGDHAVMSLSMVGISVPPIVSGPLIILVFVLGLRWFPYGGWDTAAHKVLPVITLAITYMAAFARLTRGGTLEVIHSDFIRTARAKGLSEFRVVTRHALRGAVLPTVTFLGPAFARVVTGSFVVEKVFGIPGLADPFISAALSRDYPLVLGVVVLYSTVLVLMNLLVDIAYTVLDPRVSYD